MPTFVMLTKLNENSVKEATSLKKLETEIKTLVSNLCHQVEWKENLALMGPYDYLDIFEAPSLEEAMKVRTALRASGKGEVELWPAVDWGQFKSMARRAEELMTSPA